MLNDEETKYVLGVLCKHFMSNLTSALDKQTASKILIKMMNSSHQQVIINTIQARYKEPTI
jgi:hypothetical protein